MGACQQTQSAQFQPRSSNLSVKTNKTRKTIVGTLFPSNESIVSVPLDAEPAGLQHNVLSLIDAVESGNLRKLKLNLQLGKVDVNSVDEHGNNALILAIFHLHDSQTLLQVVELLLQYGANVHHCNHVNKTAQDYALQKNQPEVLDLLTSAEQASDN